jgi:two-component system, NarL family, nitrate/nitrite response regulator NarL
LRILLASDDALARSGLALLLEGMDGLHVVGYASLDDDWPALARADDADIVVADLGAGEAAEAPALGPDVPVVVLVTDAGQARAALAAGARAVLTRHTEPVRLEAALRAVHQGLVVVDDIAGPLVRPRSSVLPTAETLTPRETEALQLLSEGLSNRQIAERLGIGERTAKFHVNSILAKLGALSRTEAVVLAARLGLVTL